MTSPYDLLLETVMGHTTVYCIKCLAYLLFYEKGPTSLLAYLENDLGLQPYLKPTFLFY